MIKRRRSDNMAASSNGNMFLTMSFSSRMNVSFATSDHGYDIKNTKRPRVNYCPSSTINTRVVCPHPAFITGQCSWCGRKADEDAAIISAYASAIPLDYVVKDMRFSKDEVAETKYENTKNLLRQRKLYLVLDLDHTLLHSVALQKMDPAEVRDLLGDAEKSLREELFNVSSVGMMTKLRPFIRTFLEEANSMFKMYIYTRGKRHYANAMASLLDPKGVYFGSRVIAKEDCIRPHEKGLDVVLGHENAVLIVDDKEKVWPDNKENLIIVEKYNYFSPNNGGDQSDGTLASVLEVLKKTHTKFFTEHDQVRIMETDVRKVLKAVNDGCKT